MGSICPHVTPYVLLIVLLFTIVIPPCKLSAQVGEPFRKLFDTTISGRTIASDSGIKSFPAKFAEGAARRLNPFSSFERLIPKRDTAHVDSSIIKATRLSILKEYAGNEVRKRIMLLDEVRKLLQADSLNQTKGPFTNKRLSRNDVLSVTGGYVSYIVNYRSNTDTPFLENNIYQNQVNGTLDFLVADQLPFTLSFLGSQTNSAFYKDFTDLQFSFNSSLFQNTIVDKTKSRISNFARNMLDSVSENLYQLRTDQLQLLQQRIKQTFSVQRVSEAHEILAVPELSYEAGRSDSVNKKNADSLRLYAHKYLDQYKEAVSLSQALRSEVDSLKDVCERNIVRVRRFRDAIQNPELHLQSPEFLKMLKSEYQLNDSIIPKKYMRLMNIRSASIGRTPLNYSELTAKNVSLNGLNFEYNSWYYFAVSAGFLDYRFREFATSRHVNHGHRIL